MNFLKVIFSAILFISFLPDPAPAQTGWAEIYKNGVVSAAEQRAAEAGVKILKQGGNAVDAAVAVQFALAVTLPRAGNVGGGGFMVIRLSDGTTRTLDFREKAPRKADRKMYIQNGEYVPELSRETILATGVPGVVDGMVKAIEHYGRLPLEPVMDPAIKLAREGYRLSWKQARSLNAHSEEFKEYKSSESYFTKPGDAPYREGDLFIQKDLASTLERISRFGREGFYSGRTADLIVDEMKRHDGLIGYEDLQNYESVWREPVSTSYKGFQLHMMPPPSSGSIAIAQMLAMLESYNLGALGFNSADYIHLVAETMRRAFADRAHFLGDPDYVEVPTDQLLSNSYNRKRMDTFTRNRASDSENIGYGKITGFSESPETTHFSIVDEDGNAVAVTTTLNGSFGNHISVGGAGFLLNNEMDDFTAKPGEPNMYGLVQGKANAVQPGKRMLSSMTPTIVTKDGKVRLILGAAGGPRIISTVLQNFLNVTVFGMNPQKAVSAPRFHHQWVPDRIYYEPFGLSQDTKSILTNRGHKLYKYDNIGRAHIIYIDENGNRQGASDPREKGYVGGY